MKFAFYAFPGHRFDAVLGKAFAKGCRAVHAGILPRDKEKYDGATPGDACVVVGVGNNSKPVVDAYAAAGKRVVFLDKGYTRLPGGPLNNLYWRMSLDAFQPHAYAHVDRPGDRWAATGLKIAKNAVSGPAILFAGSSQKYCDWHGLGPATDYAKATLDAVRPHLWRGQYLVYRPKPSWPDKRPIPGYDYSVHPRSFADELDKAGAVLTYGSNAAFEALLRGRAAIVLGDGIARSCAVTTVGETPKAAWPGVEAVAKLARSIAYCQWTLDEMVAGQVAAEVISLTERLE